MRNRQLILFFQDSIHLCTKLRNRMLSSTATMLLGNELISINHLIQLIESSSKMNHNLVKSDILPKDRQNYSSCEKISNKSVLDGLDSISNSRGTRIYLEVCLFTSLKVSKNLIYIFFLYHSSFEIFDLLSSTRKLVILIEFTTHGKVSS
jgi:hypothetical protein